VAGKNAMYEAIETLSGLAMRGPEYTAYVRVGELDGKIYVDLGRPQWECVEISADGWQILDEPPIKFRRPKNMQMLPLPVRGGNWDKFLSLLNLKDKRSKILIIAWLMQAYWPAGPYSHLDITGVQGSGKTFLQEMLKMLVDPSISNLRRPPRDERDLMISATNERIPSFDNLSGMPAHLADAFCCLSTGGALGARELYTDNEEAIISCMKPCVMNGIGTLTSRGDLLDRMITIELTRIDRREKKRLSKRKIMKAFEAIRPEILGLILDATSVGLRNLEETEEISSEWELPRLSDFCIWVAACEPALPWDKGEFLALYTKEEDNSLLQSIEDDPIAEAVYLIARDGGFYGNTTSLLQKMHDKMDNLGYVTSTAGWPKTPQGLGVKLQRVATALRLRGVLIQKERRGDSRVIRILYVKEEDRSQPFNVPDVDEQDEQREQHFKTPEIEKVLE